MQSSLDQFFDDFHNFCVALITKKDSDDVNRPFQGSHTKYKNQKKVDKIKHL